MSHNDNTKIKCLECGWIGDETDLGADYYFATESDGEIWSNHICPSCGHWGDESDYVEISCNGESGDN